MNLGLPLGWLRVPACRCVRNERSALIYSRRTRLRPLLSLLAQLQNSLSLPLYSLLYELIIEGSFWADAMLLPSPQPLTSSFKAYTSLPSLSDRKVTSPALLVHLFFLTPVIISFPQPFSVEFLGYLTTLFYLNVLYDQYTVSWEPSNFIWDKMISKINTLLRNYE